MQQNLKEEKLTLLHFVQMRPEHWIQSEYTSLEEHWLVSKMFILCQSFLIWIQYEFLLWYKNNYVSFFNATHAAEKQCKETKDSVLIKNKFLFRISVSYFKSPEEKALHCLSQNTDSQIARVNQKLLARAHCEKEQDVAVKGAIQR